jgi:alkylhydroperoxidase family enzyme
MARLAYLQESDLAEEDRDIWSYFRNERGKEPSTTHRLMAHAPGMLRAFLALADASQQTGMDKRTRELVTMMTAFLTRKEYVWAHHWKRALKQGLTEAQLRGLGSFEATALFDERDVALLRYIREAVTQYRVGDRTFDGLRTHLGSDRKVMEFMMIVAFACFTSYIHGPAEIDIEPGYEDVPSIASIVS